MHGKFEGTKDMSQPSMTEAAAKINGMFAEQMVTGSMDSEPEAFQSILTRLNHGEITAREALEQADMLVAGRQDYH